MNEDDQRPIAKAYRAYLAGDYAESFRCAELAANAGDATGWYYLGLWHRKGEGVPRDDAKASAYFEKAIAMGSVAAQVSMGRLCRSRDDMERAFGFFSGAAAAGHVRGLYWLGRAYLHGEGTPRDRERARDLLSQAIARGHVGAQLDLSKARAKGTYGVAQIVPGLFGVLKGFVRLGRELRGNPKSPMLG